MIHISRTIIGLIILYLFACTVTIFYYYLDDDLDDIKYLPRYITIPGIICVAMLIFAIVMLAAYIVGRIFIG